MQRKLIVPAIYRHFKDKYYATMYISTPISREQLRQFYLDRKLDFIGVEDSETLDIIHIYEYNGNYYHLEEKNKKQLVVYKSLYSYHGVYARPIDMFLSEVDKDKYPDELQYFRFELVKY